MKENTPLFLMEHPTSKKHPRMSCMARAAQFAPFAALVGYEEELAECRRLTDIFREPSQDEIEQMNRTLLYLCEHPDSRFATTFFIQDERKTGGIYHTIEGYLKRIDKTEGILTLLDGSRIPIEKITKIEVYENESTQ